MLPGADVIRFLLASAGRPRDHCANIHIAYSTDKRSSLERLPMRFITRTAIYNSALFLSVVLTMSLGVIAVYLATYVYIKSKLLYLL